TNNFTVTLKPVRNGPSLLSLSTQTVELLTPLTVTNTAIDNDIPDVSVSYTLLDAPAGAAIDTNGIITWIPFEGQGPSTNIVTTIAEDDGDPSMSDTNSFTVVVVVPAPPPLIDSITLSNGVATVMWESVAGRIYR